MKNICFALLSILLISCANSQSPGIDFLSKQLCSKFSEENLKLGKTELFQLVQKNSAQINKENVAFIDELKEKYMRKFPGKTDLEISQIVIQRISLQTIETCPIFTQISQKIAVLDHESNKESVKIISDSTCQSLQDYKKNSYSDLNKIVETIIYDLVIENESLIEKEYGKTGIKKFYHDLNGELMVNCELFFKMTMDLQKQ